MRRAVALVLLLGLASFGQNEVSFRAFDVWVDAGDAALGAWQVEVTGKGKALVVGVEGGDGAYKEPPFYDPAALHAERIVLAGLTLAKDPPRGRIRVARLHMQETGAVTYATKAIAAARADGTRIEVRVELVPMGEKR